MLSIITEIVPFCNYVAAWLVAMYGYLFLCSHLNLQEDSFTDGSGQKDPASSPSSESNNYSDECGLDKPLLSSPGTCTFSSPDLSHCTQVLCKLVYGPICSCYLAQILCRQLVQRNQLVLCPFLCTSYTVHKLVY